MKQEKKKFIINSSKLKDTADKLGKEANEIDNIIYDIYYTINAMNEFWQGKSYILFSAHAEKYKKNLEYIIDLIIVFKKRIDLLSSDSSDLVKNIKKRIDSLLLDINTRR